MGYIFENKLVIYEGGNRHYRPTVMVANIGVIRSPCKAGGRGLLAWRPMNVKLRTSNALTNRQCD